MAIDPELARRRRRAVAAEMVDVLEARCHARGLDTLSFVLPGNDPSVNRVLEGRGYRREDNESLQVAIVDLVGLLASLLHHRRDRFLAGWSPTLALELEPGAYRFCPQRRIRVRIGPPLEVGVLDGSRGGDPPDDVDGWVSTTLSTLTEIIFRHQTYEQARSAGQLAIWPASVEADVRALMGFLVLEGDWYTPDADGR
jgi:hypothetical protein